MAFCAACKGVGPAAIVATSPAPPPVNIFSAFRRSILLLSSKRILQRELHLAVIDGGRGDPPERRVAEGGVRTGELRRVEQIESFNAELQTVGLLNAELLEEREIPSLQTGRVDQPFARAAITQGAEEQARASAAVTLRANECGGVEPLAQRAGVPDPGDARARSDIGPWRAGAPCIQR